MPTVTRGGVHIHYEVTGAGSPVLLHTGAAGDLRMWRDAGYVRGLSGHRLISVDHRGHGLSSRPQGLDAHRIGEYAADVLAVLDAESVDRCAFVGYSDGSCVGFELAVQTPARISSLVALGSIEVSERRSALARACRAAGMAELMRLIQADEELEVPSWLWLQYLETDVEMFCLELEAWADWPGPWPYLDRIAVPALIVVGELEDPDGEARRAAGAVAQGASVELPGLGHVGAFLASDRVLAQLRPFLAR